MTSDRPAHQDSPIAADVPATKLRPRRKFRLSRLALKELRETLRDRRTIVTLVLMPLLVYPTLSLIFKTFLLTNAGMFGSGEPMVYQFGYAGNASEEVVSEALGIIGQRLQYVKAEQREANQLESENESPTVVDSDPQTKDNGFAPNESGSDIREVDFSQHHWLYIAPESELSLKQMVEAGQIDVGIDFDLDERAQWEIGRTTFVSRNDDLSAAAVDYLQRKFKEVNDSDRKFRLRKFGIPDGLALIVDETVVGPESKNDSRQAFPLASMVPLILVLMTITGAVYPAIDLTAGERERGTLEMLMAAPVPRVGILVSKFLAVWTVAVLTAMLNLIGMFATVWAFQLDKQFGGGVFNLTVMVQMFFLLMLFAAFFSALLLVVTSFAKSFKEAQVYLIPIIILSLGPGLMTMAPGMSLNGVNAVTPMVNILLLARDVINNEVMLVPAIVAIMSTLLYAYLAIRLAARVFGSDSILYADSGSFAEMFHRPLGFNRVVPILATMFCLVMLFPMNFASIGFLGRMSGESTMDLELRYSTMAVFTFGAFMVLPWVVAKHQNTSVKTGFGLRAPKVMFVFAAVLLGISLWPLVMSLTSGWHEVYGFLFGSEKQDAWHDRLIETTTQQVARIRMVSPWIIAIAFSIVPAVCEEWFFRGMLLRSLLKTNAAWKAIVISALIFGSFHVLSNSVIALDRLVPSTVIGLMLGYLAYKSDSIWPGVILHSLNNAIVIFLAYFQPRLSELPWFPGEEESIPISWVAAGLVVAAIGAGLVWSARRVESAPMKSEKESVSLVETT